MRMPPRSAGAAGPRPALSLALALVLILAAWLVDGCAGRHPRPKLSPVPETVPRPEAPPEQPPRAVPEGRAPIVRIGIAPEVAKASVGSKGPWRIGVIGGRLGIEDVAAGASWSFSADGGLLRATDPRGSGRGGASDTLFAYPAPGSGAVLEVNDKPYRGELLVFASSSGRVTVVNVLDIESYLRGVLPAEIGTGGADGFEAVKAQAVAARSYTLACLSRWRARGFDLLATVEDQVYLGVAGEKAATDRALRETSGILAVHDGRPIEAYYSSTCGGWTAGIHDAWGRPPRDYLKSRKDGPGDREAFCCESPYHRWSETWTGTEMEKILKRTLVAVLGSKKGARKPENWGRLTGLEVKKRNAARRVEALEIRFQKKTFTVGQDQVRWILRRPNGEGLRSAMITRLTVKKAKGRVTSVTAQGAGWGHGIGLCQMGALGMARAGYTYDRIVRFYYPGVRLVQAYDGWPA